MPCMKAADTLLLYAAPPPATPTDDLYRWLKRLFQAYGETWGWDRAWRTEELESAYRSWMFSGSLVVWEDPIDRILQAAPLGSSSSAFELNEWLERSLYAASLYQGWEDGRWEPQASFWPSWDALTLHRSSPDLEAEINEWLAALLGGPPAVSPPPLLVSPSRLERARAARRLLSTSMERELRTHFKKDYDMV